MQLQDYSLTGPNNARAMAQGLADAHWYQCPVDKQAMRALLTRHNGPALRDTFIWFSLLVAAGYAMLHTWGSVWFVLPFLFYAVLYASVSDSRWHESSHGTPFKTRWLNTALYEISSFLVFRESTTWRWSHVRHHTDTIIVGRDPEIASPRPANLISLALSFFKFQAMWAEGKRIVVHALGGRDPAAEDFVPESEWPTIHWKARLYVAIYVATLGAAIYTHSWLPLMFIGAPTIFGSWLISIYGYTQHAGLAENVADHRLNSRTVTMHWLNRFLYWNMNFHVEHHMYPLVPYHALPALHALVKDDCPAPYSGLWDAWKEILFVWREQSKKPDFFIQRNLPAPTETPAKTQELDVDTEDWVCAGAESQLAREDVLRVDAAGRSYAIYKNASGELFATEGICTHGNAHLANGLVIGNEIECPKHNGRFDMRDGAARRAPACVALEKFTVELRDGKLWLNTRPLPRTDDILRWSLRVLAVRNLSTFIREIELVPDQIIPALRYQPGDYLRVCVPSYTSRALHLGHQTEAQQQAWQALGIVQAELENIQPCMRNYSLATNPVKDEAIRLNVRLAFSPSNTGAGLHLGVGSAYMYSLKPGDLVEAMGPQGDFRIKESDAEMVYVGGGAGMAPLKSHLSFLLETIQTERPISFWYGARNKQEALYLDYFEQLAERHENFNFNLVLSEPESDSDLSYPKGFVHQVMDDLFLKSANQCQRYEYYLCGPPPMMAATRKLLKSRGVSDKNIAYDEF